MDIELCNLINEIFEADLNAMLEWLNTPNYNFGDSSPWTLIQSGQAEKVKSFLKALMKGY